MVRNSTDSNREFLKCENSIVQFWAPWCKNCNNLSVLEEIENEIKVKIFRVNVEENHVLKDEYYIKLLPTYICFKDGSEIKRFYDIENLRNKK